MSMVVHAAVGTHANETIHNWAGDLTSTPAKVVTVKDVADIVNAVTNRKAYPSPVRALGSHHSNTKVLLADGGTVLEMREFDKILGHDDVKMTLTAQAGALYIDTSMYLQERGLMHYVNTEFGSLSSGAASMVHTKDASFRGEHGQVSSYVVGVKMVQADGSLVTITEDDNPEEMHALRSSYGLLGIVYEVTYKIRPLQLMRLKHKSYTVDQFLANLDDIRASEDSIMIYYFPYRDRLTVEFRSYIKDPGADPSKPNMKLAKHGTTWQWRLRNFFWTTAYPRFSGFLAHKLPLPYKVRYWLAAKFNSFAMLSMLLLKGSRTLPALQTNLYTEDVPKSARITFSLFSFEVEDYPKILREYYAFVQEYAKANKWRTTQPHVGYRIFQDNSAILSHAAHGESISIDPATVAGQPEWEPFLEEYNKFCSERNGTPLLNQTPVLKPEQAQAEGAYGKALPAFREARKAADPEGRFLTPHLRDLLDL
ncbi:unnamed protein product [Ostreobium quekettii]|uniref:FAD-binding PCMH-type domain-containing protein n=1 Tax=Ostreobium quekettii TaxID=121088 RepID=A0A8S1IKN9_9CHLO|nr:unnamed protein product [Ostreobium quekettii]